ncbi:MAG: hypothetical protein JWO57_2880 [Pseudonocardiales bacterium]|nr:hypothetical protein [Pseudonocardiales bacterium]
MAEHRVSMLSASLRRYEDPERSADPRIRQLVAELRELEPAPAPRAHFRAELRAQLVAVAPRLVAEGTHSEHPAAVVAVEPEPRSLAQRFGTIAGQVRRLSLGRPLAIVTAVVAVFALLLGGAVWVSKKALPGDTLYALKRANENVQLSLTAGGTARGKQYLSFASTRADEVTDLLNRTSASALGAGPSAAGGVNPHTATLITSTLGSADSDVRAAAQLLGGQAVRNGSTDSLGVLTSWSPGQLTKLQAIVSRLPAGALHDRAASSAQLVSDALTRAGALQRMIGCSSLASAPTDALGPVPGPVCTLPPAPSRPSGPGTTTPSTGAPHGKPKTSTHPNAPATGSQPSTGTGTGTGAGTGAATNTTPGSTGTSGSSGGLTLPNLPLPSVTVQVPTLLPHTSTAPSGPSAPPTCLLSLLGICIKI